MHLIMVDAFAARFSYGYKIYWDKLSSLMEQLEIRMLAIGSNRSP